MRVAAGSPLPLGAHTDGDSVNFSVAAPGARAVTLVLFDEEGLETSRVDLDPTRHRTGSLWHARVRGVPPRGSYGYLVRRDGDPGRGDLDRSDSLLLDPYSRAVTGSGVWGREEPVRKTRLPAPEDFDWEGDRPLGLPLADTVIYELDVRGFSSHSSAGVSHPGTFAGIAEKIPYLVQLGITAVEIMPAFEFDEERLQNRDPETGEKLRNVWGYNTLAFFAPKTSYASRGPAGGQVHEFREMVKALHRAGIEVILDVVFNHTGEGKLHEKTVSFRGLANSTYYMVDEEGAYRDFTGCGNTFNANHPLVADLIVDCLRYWVSEMHVDGFRFDLASALTRGVDGEPLESPPLIERIAGDPALADTKLIAEAWDAAGLYQVGRFPGYGRFLELNGRFRDDVRRFFRGERGLAPAFATRVAGSSDLYHDLGPLHSVNFVTCHDGFTLRDLVSYDHKHNERNGEQNNDGANDNYSWSGGVEGPSDDPALEELRLRRLKSLLAVPLLSQGVPFLLAGDEVGNSKHGNNNSYCQDNEVGWVEWDNPASQELMRFTRGLLAFRRRHATLRRTTFLTGRAQHEGELPDVRWVGPDGAPRDWSQDQAFLGYLLSGKGNGPSSGKPHDILVLVNGSPEPAAFSQEATAEEGRPWRRAIDTARPSPEDILSPGQEPVLSDIEPYPVSPFSVVVLIRPSVA